MRETDLVLLCEMSIPISFMVSTTMGLSLPGSRPALCASNCSPQIWLRNASAIWLRALLWMQMKRTSLFRIIVNSNLGGLGWCATAVFFADASAGGHGEAGPEDRSRQIKPKML